MSNLTNSRDILLALRQRKAKLRKEMKTSRQHLSEMWHDTFDPEPQESVGSLVSKGLTLYQGVRMGLKVVGVVRKLFFHKRRR